MKTVEQKIKIILKLNHRQQVRKQNHSSQQNILPQNFCPNFQNKMTERDEKEDGMELDQNRGEKFEGRKKMTVETQSLAQIATNGGNAVTTNTSRTGLG